MVVVLTSLSMWVIMLHIAGPLTATVVCAGLLTLAHRECDGCIPPELVGLIPFAIWFEVLLHTRLLSVVGAAVFALLPVYAFLVHNKTLPLLVPENPIPILPHLGRRPIAVPLDQSGIPHLINFKAGLWGSDGCSTRRLVTTFVMPAGDGMAERVLSFLLPTGLYNNVKLRWALNFAQQVVVPILLVRFYCRHMTENGCNERWTWS